MPSPPSFISSNSIKHGLVRSLLQGEIERCIDAKAGLVDLLRAESLFQFLAHFFLKPWRHSALLLRDMQSKRRGSRGLRLCVGYRPVRLHLRDHEIPPAQRFFRIQERRIGTGPLRQACQQGSFSQRQVGGVLRKIKLRSRFEAVLPAAEINLVSIERKDLLLGKCALDLDRKVSLLDFPRLPLLPAIRRFSRQTWWNGWPRNSRLNWVAASPAQKDGVTRSLRFGAAPHARAFKKYMRAARAR